MPPPSPTSAKISGEFILEPPSHRRTPARRTLSGEVVAPLAGEELPVSFVHELEPSDSERVTEVPTSDEMLLPPDLNSEPRASEISSSEGGSSEVGQETIPAPAPSDSEERVPAGGKRLPSRP